jgi:hypothetical protein
MSNFKEFVVGEIAKNFKTNEKHARFWRENHCSYSISRDEECNNTRQVKKCIRCNDHFCEDHSLRKGFLSNIIILCLKCLEKFFSIERELQKLKEDKSKE